jgi:hypothetical protein
VGHSPEYTVHHQTGIVLKINEKKSRLGGDNYDITACRDILMSNQNVWNMHLCL